MKRIIICDAINEVGFEILKKEKGFEIIDASSTPKDQLLEKLESADIAITRSPTEINENFLNAGKKLKAIVRAGVGVDNVDIKSCSKRGIVVMNVPTANTIAAVEMTMCHLLNSARKYVNSCNDLKIDRIWKREKWYGCELYGKTLGVIGFGNIGSRVGIRALSFGMKVIAYDPYIEPSKVVDLGALYTSNLDEILKCDFITIHTPKTKETTDIISDNEISKMKDGVRLINCARGGLMNEDALIFGLKSGKIAYLGIDVFMKEPATNHELLNFENVCATPHLGANTIESQQNIARQAAEAAISSLRGIYYPNALNLPINTENLPFKVKKYLDLISKISYLASQINKSQIKAIKVEAAGSISEHLKPLLTFALVGCLRDQLGDVINYVNAKFVADERGIKTDAIAVSGTGYKSKVTVKIITDSEISEVSGTVFGESEERIIEINGFKTDFKPKGKMIFLKNRDVPGFIRDISAILADSKINIADFRLGRGKEGNALAVVLVDEYVDKDIIEKLNSVEACIWARYATI
ncbi:phosphoglycerate dehydrogenase [Campylobacter sp. FMV-PI01]|uniref:D-3-phosphoglycerate dehydrogenase n=2 Tax=Campylobacter portucalensis TaxID=2608384 RepID=A0A6L5WJQ9_9BACT|nr:phosphoglycerate dehydrogenase [Campylobacter portucalensis]